MCVFMHWIVSITIVILFLLFFFFNDTATTEIYTLSLHDALPILATLALRDSLVLGQGSLRNRTGLATTSSRGQSWRFERDRKSTRLNSSHANISYAVFCLKKTKKAKASRWIRDI